jgi:hypothetical protein
VVVAIGNPVLRLTWQHVLEHAGAPLGVVLHPQACVSATAEIGLSSVVLAGAVVNTNTSLRADVLVNSGAVVDHDATCAAFSQLGVNAAMACVPGGLATCSAAVKPALPSWICRPVRPIPPRG